VRTELSGDCLWVSLCCPDDGLRRLADNGFAGFLSRVSILLDIGQSVSYKPLAPKGLLQTRCD